MPKFKILRFRTNPANRELCTTKFDRLGEKTRLALCENGLGAASICLDGAKVVIPRNCMLR